MYKTVVLEHSKKLKINILQTPKHSNQYFSLFCTYILLAFSC